VLAAALANPELKQEVESLSTAESTSTDQLQLASLCDAFNFGPGPDSNRTVKDLVTEILKYHPGPWEDASDPSALHEATFLNLCVEKANRLLGWKPRWNFEETIKRTVAWYDQVHHGTVSPLEITRQQIACYQSCNQ